MQTGKSQDLVSGFGGGKRHWSVLEQEVALTAYTPHVCLSQAAAANVLYPAIVWEAADEFEAQDLSARQSMPLVIKLLV